MGDGPVNSHGGPVKVGGGLVCLVWPVASVVCSKKGGVPINGHARVVWVTWPVRGCAGPVKMGSGLLRMGSGLDNGGNWSIGPLVVMVHLLKWVVAQK